MVKENFVNPEYEVYMTSLVNESVLSKYDGASGFKMERTALLTRRLREFIFLLSKGESVIWKINKNVDYIKSVISDNIGYLYFNTYEWNGKKVILVYDIKWTHKSNPFWQIVDTKRQRNVRYPFLTGLMNYRARHKELF